MADNIAISTPGISVNDVPVLIVPNSAKHTLGKGETMVRFGSTGGGGGQSIHTEDAESKIGKMSFEMYNTAETQELISGWKQSTGANVVAFAQPGIAPVSGSNMSFVIDPEFQDSADGVVVCEFEGDPLSDNV